MATKKKKTQFMTRAALFGRTPFWAKVVFDISLLLASVITFVVASDETIDPIMKVKIGVYNTAAVLFIRGLGKCLGIPLSEQGD